MRAREQERRRARSPGFGAELADWLMPVLAPSTDAEARRIRATAHLSDVNWRTHPDYRAQAAVETVTRQQITGAGHMGRGAMALALLLRHKGGRKAMEGEPLIEALGPAERTRAEILGRAIRLGVTISGAAKGILPATPLQRGAHGLVLQASRDRAHGW